MSGDPVRILVLEDRPQDRLYLTTLFGYRGYRVYEGANGEDGLAIVETRPVDLIVSDVLMPAMDGFEFVRRLRQIDAGRDIPVMFYSATYHEREARKLADECGVVELLTKPSEPEVILARVEAALAMRGRRQPAPIADEPFDRQHARVTTDKLVEKVRELEASERRMAAIVELGRQFIEVHEPIAVLDRVRATIKEVTAAGHAVVGLFNDRNDQIVLLLADETAPGGPSGVVAVPPLLHAVAREARAVREQPAGADPERYLLPKTHAPIRSFLAVPLAFRGRVHGFVGAVDKSGAAGFTDADEQIASALGVQAALAYENAVLINKLESQAEALRRSEATTEFALSATGVAIYERDLARNQVVHSKGLTHMLPMSDAPGDDIFPGIHPDDRDAVRAAMHRAIRDRSEFAIDLRTGAPGGQVRHLQSRGQVVRGPAGSADRLVAVVIDMTERRQLEAQLRHAQKMEAIGQLAGGVAHDFNNLLTAILGYSRFLLPVVSTEEQRADVGEIIKAGERAAALTRQLLAFSRQQSRELSVFDLNALIGDLVQMLRRLLPEHVRLLTRLGSALAPIHADRGQIEQVIMNLVVNARDAMETGGEVRIETANVANETGAWVQLIVADTGVGMTEQTKARLFEPFFTTKDVGKGTGLGLPMVLAIVTQSGGRVQVDSAAGRGTKFTILLPRATGELDAPTEIGAAVAAGTEAVLLVEDEPAVAALARSILAHAGYRVTLATSVAEAVAVGTRDPVDVLVTDVLMPDGTGPDLYRQLTAARPDLKVLYISGYSQESILDTRQIDRLGAFLAKPFTAEALTHRLRELLDR
ncbi:MAG TPA: response regulator [Vicinamibacterales bacterium]|nr:response regulator [Vicinamibacterales bacterium]